MFNYVGKENFVICIWVVKGIWKKSGDWFVGVDWNECVINVYEGGWNYIVYGIGIVLEWIVGSVMLLVYEFEEYKFSWVLFMGDMFVILW